MLAFTTRVVGKRQLSTDLILEGNFKTTITNAMGNGKQVVCGYAISIVVDVIDISKPKSNNNAGCTSSVAGYMCSKNLCTENGKSDSFKLNLDQIL